MNYLKIKKNMKEDYYYYILFLSYLETLFFFVCLEINYRVGADDVIFFAIFIPLYAFFFFLINLIKKKKKNLMKVIFFFFFFLFFLKNKKKKIKKKKKKKKKYA